MTYSILISSKHLQAALEVIVILAVLVSLLAPRWGTAPFRSIEAWFRGVARSRARAITLSIMAPLIIRAALLPVFPQPLPYVHDEFSYLLMADTFAHGRIANPSPPEWKHFETEYTLVYPKYASQYQPAQGIVLAAGQVLSGRPWWGVWASVGLMCGGLCWALSYLFPIPWALTGALAAALQFGIFGFWMNSYFGGAVAAIGGALVAGSLLRMRLKPGSSAAICGAGLILLFASRPLEGAIWAAVVPIRILMKRPKRLLPVAIPAFAVLTVGAVALGYYDHRITGRAFVPPYAEGRALYGTPQSFWWQPAVTVTHFNNRQLQDNYFNQLAFWNRRYSTAALWDSSWRRLRDFWRFFIGPFFTPALFFLLFLRRDRRIRPWLLISIPFILEHATFHAWYPQHSGSETILILIILLQCWRHLRVWQRRRWWGISMSRNLAAGFATAIILVTAGHANERFLPGKITRTWASLVPAQKQRDHLVSTLREAGGKYLVFVYYSPEHPYIDEWVFNGASIPGSAIVFARLVDPTSDARLVRAMPGYEVVYVDADTGGLARRGPGGAVISSSGQP